MLYLKDFLEKFNCDLLHFITYFDDIKFEWYYTTNNDRHITYFDNEYSFHGNDSSFVEHINEYFDYTSDMFDDSFVYLIDTYNNNVIDDLESCDNLDDFDNFNIMLLIQYVHEV